MRKKISFILFIFSFFIIPCLCQQARTSEDRVLFRGVVIASSNNSRLAYSSIFINRSFSAITGEDGTFSFFAHRYDTILISNLGYKSSSFIVSDTLKGREFLTGIFLESDTVEIGEVIIVPKMANLRAEMMKPGVVASTQLENARTNVTIASYQGRTGQGKLGDPNSNYELLKHRQKINAFEKGGIPSDNIAGISPLMLIPAAYLLMHGLPEKPDPPAMSISNKEIEELNNRYLELLRSKK
jgi:hypothetical protein